MRYLGLDVGSRFIGVAVGEALASELTTLEAQAHTDFYNEKGMVQAVEKIDKILHDEEVDAIVIGLPMQEDGSLSKEAEKIKAFGDELGKAIDKVIHYVNETLTSFMAEEMLESQGMSIAEAKKREHQLAAQLILQQYLEENAQI